MRIGIIDADLLGRKKHRFPNLACEKISGYWSEKGDTTELLLNYDHMLEYDKVYISKVFTDTPCPEYLYSNEWLSAHPSVQIGGTGFYFDKAPNLPDEIEHHMPDYHLYDDWIAQEVQKAEIEAIKDNKVFNKQQYMIQFKEYLEYSIGFITRGCFRKCGFCVNQKYDHVFLHSPLNEFYDPSRKKICLLDDNFFGSANWREKLQELIDLNRPFKFKQGLDERLLTQEKCDMLFNAKYDGDFTFAFDNISDYDLIHSKLKMIKKALGDKKKSIKFYVLVGYESIDAKDIENAFKRIDLLMRYGCLPYIMRYQNKNDIPWTKSDYRSMYVTLARWCNQPSFFKKKSFREYCEANQLLQKTPETYCSSMKAMLEFEKQYPDIAERYFDLRFDSFNGRCMNG